MIFSIRNLGFELGSLLLEGWAAFAARVVCAALLLALDLRRLQEAGEKLARGDYAGSPALSRWALPDLRAHAATGGWPVRPFCCAALPYRCSGSPLQRSSMPQRPACRGQLPA